MAVMRSRHPDLFAAFWAELTPFPGRVAGSLRDTLALVLALGVDDAAGVRHRTGVVDAVPAAARAAGRDAAQRAADAGWRRGCRGRDDRLGPGDGWHGGGALPRHDPGIFIAAFGMGTTSLPLAFTIFGFYGYVDLGAWDAHRSPNAIVTTSLYGIASLAIVAASAVLVEYLFGSRRPAEELQSEMAKRLDCWRASSTAGRGAGDARHRAAARPATAPGRVCACGRDPAESALRPGARCEPDDGEGAAGAALPHRTAGTGAGEERGDGFQVGAAPRSFRRDFSRYYARSPDSASVCCGTT